MASGVILLATTIVALWCENSAFKSLYHQFIHFPLTLGLPPYSLTYPLSHWINDGLMVLFFLLVGLEIKREILVGHLATRAQLLLPTAAAIGGMLVPALIYVALNYGAETTLRGWAIPSATDIAFALGVLSLLGPRVPASLRVFLTALAIIDDLGAVLIIAFFYTATLSYPDLFIATAILASLLILNRRGVRSLTPYLILGIPLWLAVLHSGVHATVAGVLLAFTIPLRLAAKGNEDREAPLLRLEHLLAPWVAFLIMPLFAFANAGLDLGSLSFASLVAPLPLGISAGLFIGKQSGIMLAAVLCVRAGIAPLPQGATWGSLYGVALLAGIGFTMSLFIGSLAFQSEELLTATRLGVLFGSLLSALVGLGVLALNSPKTRTLG